MNSEPREIEIYRLVCALRDLVENPMPSDLITIRSEVEKEYAGDEDAAEDQMDFYCSQDYMEEKLAAYRDALKNAVDILKNYDYSSECSPR